MVYVEYLTGLVTDLVVCFWTCAGHYGSSTIQEGVSSISLLYDHDYCNI